MDTSKNSPEDLQTNNTEESEGINDDGKRYTALYTFRGFLDTDDPTEVCGSINGSKEKVIEDLIINVNIFFGFLKVEDRPPILKYFKHFIQGKLFQSFECPTYSYEISIIDSGNEKELGPFEMFYRELSEGLKNIKSAEFENDFERGIEVYNRITTCVRQFLDKCKGNPDIIGAIIEELYNRLKLIEMMSPTRDMFDTLGRIIMNTNI